MQQQIFDFFAGYIVPPCHDKDDEVTETHIQGSPLTLGASVAAYFEPLYSDAMTTCSVEIIFNSIEGQQQNPIRSLISEIGFSTHERRVVAAKQLAVKLARATDGRSQTGLLTICVGKVNNRTRIVLLRFPADKSLQATFAKEGLDIAVNERSFLRNAKHFKAAVFEDTQIETGFWYGKVEDRQSADVSDLWVPKFLQASTELTSERASRMLGKRIRDLVRDQDNFAQQLSIASASTIIHEQTDRDLTMNDIAENYIPQEQREDFLKGFSNRIREVPFRVNPDVFKNELKLRSVVLSNGLVVTGPVEQFDNADIYSQSAPNADGIVEITLRGRIQSTLLKSRS